MTIGHGFFFYGLGVMVFLQLRSDIWKERNLPWWLCLVWPILVIASAVNFAETTEWKGLKSVKPAKKDTV